MPDRLILGHTRRSPSSASGVAFTLAVASIAPIVPTQTTSVTVPSIHAGRDGFGGSRFPFSSAEARVQHVVDGAAIAPTSATLIAFEYRPDNGSPSPLAAKTVSVCVSLSPTRVTPATVSTRFASNVATTPSVVFQGDLSLPAYAPVRGSVAPWSIRVPFATPFPLVTSPAAGGDDLLIDVTTTQPLPTSIYFVDAASAAGGITWIGNQGPGLGTLDVDTVVGGDLFPGGEVVLGIRSLDTSVYFGTPVDGTWLLGASRLEPPLDLGPFGAPLQELHTLPFADLPYRTAPIVPPCAPASSTLRLPVPNDPTLAGGLLYAQPLVRVAGANALDLVLLEAFEFNFRDNGPFPLAQIESRSSNAAVGTRGRPAMLRFDGTFQ